MLILTGVNTSNLTQRMHSPTSLITLIRICASKIPSLLNTNNNWRSHEWDTRGKRCSGVILHHNTQPVPLRYIFICQYADYLQSQSMFIGISQRSFLDLLLINYELDGLFDLVIIDSVFCTAGLGLHFWTKSKYLRLALIYV